MAAEKRDSTVEAPSHSRLSCLHACRRRYYYKYVQRLQARGIATRPHAGKVGHAGLDVLYRMGYGAKQLTDNVMQLAYGDHVPSEQQKWLTLPWMQQLLSNYMERWPEDDSEFKPYLLHERQLIGNDKVLWWAGDSDERGYVRLGEQPVVVQIADDLAVTVVIDLLVESQGGVWVVDHKFTCGYLGGGFLNKHLVSHQMPLYIAAVRAIIGSCDGGIYNALFMGQAANNPASKAVKFDRYPFDYTPGQLEESLAWARGTQRLAASEQAAYGWSAGEELWLQNPAAGCSGCDYLQLCEVAPAMRAGRIANWYQQKEEADGDEEGSD